MAVRKTARSGKAAARKSIREHDPDMLVRRASAIAGGVLICAALAWFGWLLLRQHNPGLTQLHFSFPGLQVQPTAQPTVDPLLAAGITLSTPAQGQTTHLSQQQARLLADQLEPQAAVHASSVSTEYVLLTYKGGSATTGALQEAPAWMIHYTRVSVAAPDTAADPHATSTPHDCYLFLDANSGQELFALWT